MRGGENLAERRRPVERRVDSWAYAFAYRIRGEEDFPGDFRPAESMDGVRAAIFLPGEPRPRFLRALYPPRILLLRAQELLIATHPSAKTSLIVIPFKDLLVVETGRFLLNCWLRIATAGSEWLLRHTAQGAKLVDELLTEMKPLALQQEMAPTAPTTHLGPPLSLKFSRAEEREALPGEQVRLRWFSPATRTVRKGLFGRRESGNGSDYLALTSRRWLWISDGLEGRRQPYGTVNRSAPWSAARAVDYGRASDAGQLVIELGGGVRWQVPITEGREAEARRFVELIRQETWKR